MALETLEAALLLIPRLNVIQLTIGGGEPTTHPHFFQCLDLILKAAEPYDCAVGIVTNGKRKDAALKLAQRAREEEFYASLSQDPFHEPIDPEVIQAFQPRDASDRVRHNVLKASEVTPHGRAKNWGPRYYAVCCGGPFVTPSGRLFACECREFDFGTVQDYHIPTEYLEDHPCGKELRKQRIRPYHKTRPPTQLSLPLALPDLWLHTETSAN